MISEAYFQIKSFFLSFFSFFSFTFFFLSVVFKRVIFFSSFFVVGPIYRSVGLFDFACMHS